MDIVKKLQTLPKLGNLVLQGNPLAVSLYWGKIVKALYNMTTIFSEHIHKMTFRLYVIYVREDNDSIV